jgi:IS5 family transposase
VEEALYDWVVMRQFVGIDLGQEAVPDETTACKFRHLLEELGLCREILQAVNLYLESQRQPIKSLDQDILVTGARDEDGRAPGHPDLRQEGEGSIDAAFLVAIHLLGEGAR